MTLHTKTAIILLVTLIIGFLLGVATSGYLIFSHMRDDNAKHERFKRIITKILELDEAQQRQAEPFLEDHANRVRATNEAHRESMLANMDTLKLQLQPILTAEQAERLEHFRERLKEMRGRPPMMLGPRGRGKPGRPRRPAERRPE